MRMLILNVERISQKNGTTGNKLFPQGDGGHRGMELTGGWRSGHLLSFFLVSSFGQCLLQQVQVATG
jgi:hypothetical protein